MKKKEEIDRKLANYLSGNQTELEKNEVEAWIRQSKGNTFQFNELKKLWEKRTNDYKLIDHESVKSTVWSSYQRELPLKNDAGGRKFWKYEYRKLAAVILILLLPAVIIIYQFNGVNSVEVPLVEGIIVKKNPSGQKSQIQLPDGSKVWLNAQSTISYKENFSDSSRVINLVGEAYFEVMHDVTKPFSVQTDDLLISVLGTGFNVSAYEDENDVVVALVHGSVKVQLNDPSDASDILLSPGKGITFSKRSEEFQNFSMDDDEILMQKYTAWKDGLLVFDGNNFQSFVKKISRWYGLRVIVSGIPPEGWHVRAAFKNEYLENILNAVSFNKEFQYKLDSKELKLMFN